MIIVVLVLALAYFAVDKFVLNPHREKSAPRMSSSGTNGTPNEKSVAVLAFANLSDDKGGEYFSDGISEELLTVLQKIPGLHVAARTSAFSFKGQNATAQEIGQKLGVAHLVEGSVRKAGDMLWWNTDQLYDSVRNDPRFQAIMQKVDRMKAGTKP